MSVGVAETDGHGAPISESVETPGPLYSGPRGLRQLAADAALTLAGAVAALLLLPLRDGAFAALWLPAVMIVVRSDLERYLIPDTASLMIGSLGLLRAATGDAGSGQPSLLDAVGCGVAAFALFWLVSRGFSWGTGRQGLGFGDVKLAAACAVWLDVPDQVLALEIAAGGAVLLTLLRRRASNDLPAAIPFGAFLAPAAWLVYAFGPFALRLWGTA